MEKMRKETMVKGVLAALFLLYLLTFFYLNVTQYENHVDSDMASEALLSKHMWQAGSVMPDDWYPSTERRLLSTSLLGALFYGASHSMSLAIGLSCIVFMVLLLGGYGYLLKRLKISATGRMAGLLLLLALPANCVLAEGQMLPYFTYLFFLFAGYYAPMGVFLFWSLGFYVRLIDGGWSGRREVLWWALFSAASLALGCAGMRTLEMVLLPLLLLEFCRLYRMTERFSCRMERKNFRPAAYVLLLTGINCLGMVMPFSVEYTTKFVSQEDAVSNFLGTVLPSLLMAMGLAGGVALKSLGGLIQLCIYALAAFTIYAFFVFFSKEAKEEQKERWESSRLLLLFFGISLLLTLFILTVTMIGASANYFFAVTFLFAFSLIFLLEWLQEKSPLLRYGLLLFIVIYAVLNFAYTYVPALRTEGANADWQEAVAWMEENEYEYGYAEFWDANKLTLCAEGRVTVAPVVNIASLEPYLWLTSRNYYPPALPVEMRTAYIVRRDRREAFEQTLDLHQGLEIGFENERFVIYTGSVNYAIIFPETEAKQGAQMAG